MQLPWLESETPFPDTRSALGLNSPAPGLLAAGGGLSVARLQAAYSRGIFPWYSPGQPVLWWSTDPRMVLPVEEFKLSRSLRKTLQRFLLTPGCEIRIDHDFGAVIQACGASPRAGQNGSWIVPEIVAAYRSFHKAGHAHSVETWIDGELAGGLYAVNLGRMVFGESMFARRTDASKIALAALVALCRAQDVRWIDCQQETEHLASLGARPVARGDFEAELALAVHAGPALRWNYDRSHWRSLGLRIELLAPPIPQT
jgi:leucyl/phenylalanyl-tRNA--protein transferase